MSRILTLVSLVLLWLISFAFPFSVSAQSECSSLQGWRIVSQPNYGETGVVRIQLPNTVSNLGTGTFYIDIDPGDPRSNERRTGTQLSGAVFNIDVDSNSTQTTGTISLKQVGNPDRIRCPLGSISYSPNQVSCTISSARTKYTIGEDINVGISYSPPGNYNARICMPPRGCTDTPSPNPNPGFSTRNLPWGTYTITGNPTPDLESAQFSCFLNIVVCADANSPDCIEPLQKVATALTTFKICDQVKPEDHQTCQDCFDKDGLWTGLGCIRTSTDGLVQDLMTILVGMAGGIALLLMLYGAFIYATAGGDPKKASQAKEVFGGAVMGLLFIIFSIIILNFVGVTILNLPGF